MKTYTYTLDKETRPGYVIVTNSEGKIIKEITVKEFEDTNAILKTSQTDKKVDLK